LGNFFPKWRNVAISGHTAAANEICEAKFFFCSQLKKIILEKFPTSSRKEEKKVVDFFSIYNFGLLDTKLLD
jgi:hypothetical protein